MRGIISYIVAGALVVLALDMITPFGLGLAVGAGPETGSSSVLQYVDRSNKGDRLLTPAAVNKPSRAGRPRMMAGCEPAFSPLSVSAQANFAARCMA